jgi:hypothetical protein
MSFYCILFVNCVMSNELLFLALCIIIMTVSISVKIQWKANKYVCMYVCERGAMEPFTNSHFHFHIVVELMTC